MNTRTTAIVGTGRVACVLGRALNDAGVLVQFVAGRDRERTEIAARAIGAEAIDVHTVAEQAGQLIIAVSDGAIPQVAGILARKAKAHGIALHTCGALGSDALAPLCVRGFHRGTFHPLQTIPSCASAGVVRNIWFGVSGDERALVWCRELAAALNSKTVNINDDVRALYHAGAVMASNHLLSLLDAAEFLLVSAGLPKEHALPALAPLVRSTVENAFRSGPSNVLTGPVSRGDAETVHQHLTAIGQSSDEVASFYRAAAHHLLTMSDCGGPEKADRIRRALEE